MRITSAPARGRVSRLKSIAAAAVLLLTFANNNALAATFIVDSTADAADVIPGDGVCATAAAQCTLRAAIEESNAFGAANTIAFSIPPADPGFNAGTGVYTITPATALPAITDVGNLIDGTTQTSNQGDTNPGMLGSGGRVGVGPDGVAGTLDEPVLPQVAAPEIQIVGTNAIPTGIDIDAGNITIRGLALYGFGNQPNSPGKAAIRIGVGHSGTVIEQCVVGTSASSFSDPGAGARTGADCISKETFFSGGSGIVRNNLIGYCVGHGISLKGLITGANGWLIERNEIVGVAIGESNLDGIEVRQSSNTTIRENRIVNGDGVGIDTAAPGPNTIENNTVSGNGVGVVNTAASPDETAGIRVFGDGSTLQYNLIHGNYGAGILVASGADNNTMRRNSLYDNGTIDNDGLAGASGQIGIDLLASTDADESGTPPYVTLNDDTDADTDGNDELNFPVLDTAQLLGGNLDVSGWARPGSVIELYIGDGDPSGFGEGKTYLITLTEAGTGAGGDDPFPDLDGAPPPPSSYGPGAVNGIVQGQDTTNRFRFVLPTPGGVGAGTELTATATDGAGNTSEFGGIVSVTSTATISGTVFEDVNYGGGGGRDQASAAGVARPGARVELYDAAGAFMTFTTTDGSGNYSFAGLAAATHTVRVVNASVSSSRGGYVASLRGVQTFRTDASGGSAVAETARVGGQNPAVVDAGNGSAGAVMNTTTGVFTAVVSGTAQSITNVALGASDIPDVDFGYNFDTIVNVNADGQGSLHQFITNANALANAGLAQAGQTAGKEVSIFMIPVVQLTAGVAVIEPTSLLPPMTGANAANTVIDGTTQTANIGDTNLGISGTGFLGAGGSVGLGPDGVAATADEATLSQVAAPEVEIKNDGSVRTGLDVQVNSITIRGIAIHGFGENNDADIDGNIRVGLDGSTDYVGALIEQNVIGATAFNFVSPPIPTDGDGLIIRGADGGILRNNLIGFHYRSGLKTHDDVTGWLFEDNEIRANGTTTRYGDAIDLGYNTSTATIRRNLLINNGASGVDSYESNGANTISENTISGNGFAGQVNQETSGIRLFGTDSDVTLNLIQNNFGAGVLVVGNGAALNQPALRNKISRNAFAGNGSNSIDLLANGGDTNFGDGITLNGGAANACSYLTSTGNDGLEFPLIASVDLSGGTTTVVGQGCPNSSVEVYRASAGAGDTSGGSDYGEGERYLGATTTNGAGDFTFVTTALAVGDVVSAIVIDASDNTSEFGPNVVINTAIIKRAYQSDGTPFVNGSALPVGTPVKFMLYINNPGAALSDVSVTDVLDPLFAYVSGTIKTDNVLVSSVVCPAGVCDEAAIFTQVDSSGTSLGDGDSVTAPIDADEASYTSGTFTIDLGDQNNPANAQLNVSADSVWAMVFTVRMQ